MDPAKIAFLFGDVPDGLDADDSDDRMTMLAGDTPDAAQLAMLGAVADQIASDNPPQVWRTAQRLLAEGHDRLEVLPQLAVALTESVLGAVDREEFDLEGYVAALDRLPLPAAADVERMMIEIVRGRPGIELDELDELVADQLDLPPDGEGTIVLLDRVSDYLVDPDGPLEILAGDRVVHVGSLTGGIVLTHRLSEAERSSGVLDIGVDLAGFRRWDELRLPDGPGLDVVEDGWIGPEGWLAAHPADAVLAVRLDSGVVTVTALTLSPPVPGALGARLRAQYDREVEEPWLPVTAEELVLGVLLDERSAFAEPTAPLSELIEAAGLETRGTLVAHEESVWRNEQLRKRTYRVLGELDAGDRGRAALRALSLIDDGPPDRAASREVLDLLYDPEVLEVVPNELLGMDDDPEPLAETGALVERLLAAAGKGAQQAVAHWLAAVVDERRGEVLAAESHLRTAARADPGWPCAADRLAWYCSDRGDAADALAIWHGLGLTAADSDDVRTLAALAAPDGPKLGRNEPCWCGSGRKFKACHLGRAERAALPDRVGWLCRKAAAYLERRGGAARDAVFAHVAMRAVDPFDPDSIGEALADPIVIDVVLHEGGWFDRFLADRGPLLPDDEALLARAWALVDRTVYEVVEVLPGAGVTVRDLRTGDVVEVRERTFSQEARPGALVCARAVPDGESQQFVGGIFGVAPGHERDLLALLDERDGPALLSYVADLHRPPIFIGPDGEVIEVPLPTGEPPAPLPPASPEIQAALLGFRDDQELRWCDEHVPALGGMTPRAAAADPTRREELARLIASFPDVDPSTGFVGLRPTRLRELLDLPAP